MFDDDDVLLHAVKDVRKCGYEITDVYTPFPVHGLEHANGFRTNTFAYNRFFLCATGLTVALSMITFINVFNYPTNFGGKPFFGLLAYVPISFEHTVLYFSNRDDRFFLLFMQIMAGKTTKILDERTSNHLFCYDF